MCAPTGAGKTNVAMLTLLQLINQYRDSRTGVIDKVAIKAVYIAPMKALAQVCRKDCVYFYSLKRFAVAHELKLPLHVKC